MKKFLSAALAVLMIVSVFPMSVSAANDFGSGIPEEMTVISDDQSTLAPGITQRKIVVYDKNNNRVEMFVAVADTTVDTVNIYANYMDNQNEVLGMQKTTDQVAAAEAKHEDPYSVVVAINASYYNTSNGKPTGAFVMEGNDVTTESQGNAYPFFAILKDGTAMIGSKGEYSSYKGQIQEAVGGYIHLVKDGAICSGLNTVDKYPRQTVGLTADGKVIVMTADGNQAPRSDGLTVQEQAEVMLAMGCVEALHLDGGGSATYCSKAEGSDTLEVVNSPSNGTERSVSNTLMFVSTAVADGTFDHAIVSADNEYVTPGSTVTLSAKGVDAAGGVADIPENATYQVKDVAYGKIEGNKFVSSGEMGAAVIQMVVDGAVVGETTVNVVVPDSISFGREQLTVPYGETVDVKVTALYGVNEVAYKAGDITLSLADTASGSIDGLKITASDASSGITSSTLTATLTLDPSVAATVAVKYGKGSEVIFDFESGTAGADTDNWIIRTHESGIASNEQGEVYVVNEETGRVHNGNQALAFNCDFSQSTGSGSSTAGYIAMSMSWAGDPVSVKGAQTLGFWVYIPEDAMTTEFAVNTVYNNGTSRRTVDGMDDSGEYIYTPYWKTNMEESGWQYITVDLSKFADDLYIMDAPKLSQAYKRNFFIKIYCVFGSDTIDFADHHGDHTFYIDDITVDYSDAVADRERPVFSGAMASGVFSDKALNYGEVASLTEKNVVFSANVADNMTKANYSGIDGKTAKIYVDGNLVKTTYANGVMTSEDVELADGYHRIKFEIADNSGNFKTIIREVYVNAGSSLRTVELVARDASLDRLLSGSVYWVDLKSDSIADIDKIEAIIDLNSINEFELDQMVVASGFDVTYTSTAAQDAENTVVLTITRNGEKVDASNNVIVSIPVRIWESLVHTYPGHEKETPAYMWTSGRIDARELRVYLSKGLVTFTDDSSSFFSGNIQVDTEAYTHYYNMDADYHAAKGSYHVHTAEAQADVAATCTQAGYTGRTYCAVCDSVVEWGETVKATGHDYKLVDGKLTCDCGEVKPETGVYTDENGTHYVVNGVAQTGWQYIDGTWYLFDKATTVAVTGTYAYTDEITYEFDESGKMVKGFWAKTLYGTRYYYGPDYYKNGWQTIDGKEYFFDQGYRVEGGYQMLYENYKYRNWYYFDENGVCDKTHEVPDGFYTDRNGYAYSKDGEGLAGIQNVNGKYYYFDHKGYAQKNGTYSGYLFKDEYAAYTGLHEVNGQLYYYQNGKTGPCGLVEIDGDYYYSYWGGVIKTGKQYVDTTYCDLPAGNYEFGADGKMLNGIVEKDGKFYYYDNGKTGTYGLIEHDSDYYFINWGGELKTNGKYYVDTTYCDLPVGNYEFGADGKMLNGVVDKDGVLYYYENGKTGTCGLYEFDGSYYYSYWGGVLKTNGKYYVDTTFCDLPVGNYTFGADGKMLSGIAEVDGVKYLYINGKTSTCGLFKVDGDYYYAYWGGVIKTNGKYYVDTTFCDLPVGNYTFGADGKMLNGPAEVDGKLYFYDTGKTGTCGLYEFEGNYYYSYWGGVLKTNGKYYVENSFCDLPAGNYEFDAEGKMLNGFVEKDGVTYYYQNGKTATCGLIEIDGDYYYIYWGGVVKTGKCYVEATFCDLPVGNYEFGADGKMLDGIVEKDGALYYYENGRCPAPGLIELDGYFYFVDWGGKLITNQKFYVWETNGYSLKMTYTFNELGQIVL